MGAWSVGGREKKQLGRITPPLPHAALSSQFFLHSFSSVSSYFFTFRRGKKLHCQRRLLKEGKRNSIEEEEVVKGEERWYQISGSLTKTNCG